MKPTIHDLLLRLIALLIAAEAFLMLVGSFGEGVTAFGALRGLVASFVLLATAVGFWRRRGWAFLVVSVTLLVGWFDHFIRLIVEFSGGHSGSGKEHLAMLVLVMVLIGYLGRWKIERLFRPHLDSDAHH